MSHFKNQKKEQRKIKILKKKKNPYAKPTIIQEILNLPLVIKTKFKTKITKFKVKTKGSILNQNITVEIIKP